MLTAAYLAYFIARNWFFASILPCGDPIETAAMRPNTRLTARQLTSVCGRYQHGLGLLNAGDTPAFSSRPWQLLGPSANFVSQPAFARPRRDHRLQRLEAVFFLSREPLTTRKLSQYANLADGTEARTLIRRLNDLYDASGRAFRVERVAGGFQLLTRRKLSGWVRRLEGVPRETRLSAPAMETLAVIAYRQPILRADIEAVRGVNCGEILRQLMDRELVRIGGRSEDLGRPYLYTTTKHFLRVFGLDSLDSLPRVERLRRDGPDLAPTRHPADAPGESWGAVEPVSSEEEGNMPVLTRSGLTWDQPECERVGDKGVDPRAIKTHDEGERLEYVEDADFDEEDEEDEEDDFDDELDDEDLEEEEVEEEEVEDEELEDEWEEVEDEEDEEDWEDEDDDSEWDYDDEDEDEDEEEEEEDWV